jgi:hypothetical protein
MLRALKENGHYPKILWSRTIRELMLLPQAMTSLFAKEL